MFATAAPRARTRDPGDSPFWISFADLMTALMTLFLVVMCVTLLAVTRSAGVEDRRKAQRDEAVARVMADLQQASKAWPQVTVDVLGGRVDLGELVRFERGRHELTPAGERFLRGYFPVVLDAHRSEAGRRWIRRIVVEGFADQDGDYLYNMGLSLARGREVVCALFRAPGPGEAPLSQEQLREIRDLVLVGGYAFNGGKASKEASRRVELKVEFWQLGEAPAPAAVAPEAGFGRC